MTAMTAMTAAAVDSRLLGSSVSRVPGVPPAETHTDRRLLDLVAAAAIHDMTLPQMQHEAALLLTGEPEPSRWLQDGLLDLLGLYQAWQAAAARDLGRAAFAYSLVSHQAVRLADRAFSWFG